MKSYANIVKDGHMEATSGPTAIKEMCKILNVEQLEREKKKKNVILSDVPEPFTYLCHELCGGDCDMLPNCKNAERRC